MASTSFQRSPARSRIVQTLCESCLSSGSIWGPPWGGPHTEQWPLHHVAVHGGRIKIASRSSEGLKAMDLARYRFLDFELDCARHELRRGGAAVKLENLPFDLLVLVVESNGDLVTRESIVERLWGAGIYQDTEQGINTAIRKIRQALQDDPQQPQYLQTVVGHGYRFIAPVIKEPEESECAVAGEGVVVAIPSAVPVTMRRYSVIAALMLLIVASA